MNNVLFLCTGNSARSILAEAILTGVSGDRFRAFSAGSAPTGSVNPHALSLLKSLNYVVSGLRSKSVDEFLARDAPSMDFVFTVCDAAAEACPVFPSRTMSAHWGIADPARVDGSETEIARAFRQAYRTMAARIDAFVALPVDTLDRAALAARIAAIGRLEGATEKAAGIG